MKYAIEKELDYYYKSFLEKVSTYAVHVTLKRVDILWLVEVLSSIIKKKALTICYIVHLSPWYFSYSDQVLVGYFSKYLFQLLSWPLIFGQKEAAQCSNQNIYAVNLWKRSLISFVKVGDWQRAVSKFLYFCCAKILPRHRSQSLILHYERNLAQNNTNDDETFVLFNDNDSTTYIFLCPQNVPNVNYLDLKVFSSNLSL